MVVLIICQELPIYDIQDRYAGRIDMCGIAGMYSFDSDIRIDESVIDKLSAAIKQRGPDGSGKWISSDRSVGFAHRRLAIQDLTDAASQPMHSKDGKVVLVYNGEIYNFKELRIELVDKFGIDFKSSGDTEVILELYILYGKDFVNRLRGMFAIAIWDSRCQKMLLLRDPHGIKPLYYSNNSGMLHFSSEIKPLEQVTSIDKALDPVGCVSFFLWGHVQEPWTVYKSIKSVPPGCIVEFENGKDCQTVTQYWDLGSHLREFMESSSEVSLYAAMSNSVQAHLVSDVPVGIFLSSGIDSSVLAGLISDIGYASNVTGITLGFDCYDNTEFDETKYAAQTASYYGISHKICKLSKSAVETGISEFLLDMDSPTIDGLNTWFVSKSAKELGFKVVMTGLGADELFGGYSSFQQVPLLVGFAKHIPLSIGKAVREIVASSRQQLFSPKYAGILEYGRSYKGAFLLRRGLYMPWEIESIFGSEFTREGLEILLGKYNDSGCFDIDDVSEHRRLMYLENKYYLRSRLLRDSDWASMAHGIELRTPYVDSAFFEFMNNFTDAKNHPTKRQLAALPRKRLPDNIFNRPKTGFNVPIKEWMFNSLHVAGKGGYARNWAKYIFEQKVADLT